MTGVATTLAEATVAAIVDAGIDTVYGIGGTHTLQLLGAIERSPLRFVPARTEIGAAYMAIGHARAAGRIAVVLTSTGPGAINAMSALEDARWSSTPVLHLTTSSGGDRFAGAVHETPHQAQLLELVGKHVELLSVDDVGGSVRHAIDAALARPSGPVTLIARAGTWGEPAASLDRGQTAPSPDADLGDVAAALGGAQRPVIFAGGGSTSSDGGTAVRSLAERLGAPILTSYQGRVIASWDHPLYLGPWATEPSVRELWGTADLALVFGSKLSALGTSAWQLPLPAETYSIGPSRPHQQYPQLRPVDADAAAVADALAAQVPHRAPWADIRPLVTSVLERVERDHPLEIGFLRTLERTGRHRQFTADMSKAGFWAMKYLAAPDAARQLFSSYLAMGSALPMAIGMSIATNEPVTALVGDGALQMSLAELGTVGELALPVDLLVVVDNAYGILRDNCAAVGGSRSMGVDLWNPDLALLGEAFGFEVHQANDPGRAQAVLQEDPKQPRLVLLHQPFSRDW